jgi:hypothetical protein
MAQTFPWLLDYFEIFYYNGLGDIRSISLEGSQSSTHITLLTSQAVRGRSMVVEEGSELRLVWVPHRILIKPIP